MDVPILLGFHKTANGPEECREVRMNKVHIFGSAPHSVGFICIQKRGNYKTACKVQIG
jgi:hypothetical protein